ncbi:MAG: hypothetical protein ABWK01_03130 [Infirmifilum sp.]
MSCFGKTDYVLLAGVLLLTLGLSVDVFGIKEESLKAPPVLLVLATSYLLYVLAGWRGRNKNIVLLAASVTAILSTPYFFIAASQLEDYIRSGKISSVFTGTLVNAGASETTLIFSLLAFTGFLATLLLSRLLIGYLLPGVKEGGSTNPILVTSELPKIKSWSLFGFLVGFILVVSLSENIVESTMIVYLFATPIPLHFSLFITTLLQYQGLNAMGLLESLSALTLFSVITNISVNRKVPGTESKLLLLSSSLLLLTLLFFILFGALFTQYLLFYILSIFLLTLVILYSEGMGFLLSPYLLFYVIFKLSGINASGMEAITLLASPLAPLLIASAPAISANLYYTFSSSQNADDECSYLKIFLITILAAPLSHLIYNLKTPQLTVGQQLYFTPVTPTGIALAFIAVIATLAQQRVSKEFFNRGSTLFLPLSLTPFHPVGIFIANIFLADIPSGDCFKLALLSGLILIFKIVAYFKHIPLREFSLMVMMGAGTALLLHLLL